MYIYIYIYRERERERERERYTYKLNSPVGAVEHEARQVAEADMDVGLALIMLLLCYHTVILLYYVYSV